MADVVPFVVGITLFTMPTSYNAAENDMCTTSTVDTSRTYSFTYMSDIQDKDCCCSLKLPTDNLSFNITVNAEYFVLIYPTKEQELITPGQVIRNVTNNTILCATKMFETTISDEYGVMNISGDKGFTVQCNNIITNMTTINITSEKPVTLSMGGDVSTSVYTSVKSLEDSTTTVTYSTTSVPPSETTSLISKQNTTKHSVRRDDDNSHSGVTWIVIGAVAGCVVVIILIIGVVLWRKRSGNKDLVRRPQEDRVMRGIIMADNCLYNQDNSQDIIYSLAQNTDHVSPMSRSDTTAEGDGNGLMMADNCLYNHQEGQDGHSPDSQTQSQTSGRHDQSGEDGHHREEPDFSHLYAKVNK